MSYRKPVRVSSGQNATSAVDENIRTWWTAADNKPGEWIEVDLCEEADVRAIQINFADENLELLLPENAAFGGEEEVRRLIDGTPHKIRWLLEGSLDGTTYWPIKDNRKAETDLPHDFVVIEDGVNYRYIRLTVTELPYGQRPRVSGLRVFGRMDKERPVQAKAEARRIGDLDMEICWEAEGAMGVNMLWGNSPDKLYHSYLVFGKNRQVIGALCKDQAVYIRVDSFHEGGITTGALMEVRARP